MAFDRNIFSYGSLFSKADFTGVEHIPHLFEALQTRDFEAVIRFLIKLQSIIEIYDSISEELFAVIAEDIEKVKNALASSVANNHPPLPFSVTDEQYRHCRAFLRNFRKIYTLNYDVLLYWALMHDDVDDEPMRSDDGFRHPEGNEDAPYVSWQSAHSPSVFYMHGALHLFDAGHEITKYTWSKTRVPIVEQIRSALDEEKYPLFVSEGHSHEKLDKIMHNAYLHKALRSFSSIGGSLFVFGHSFDDNDDHILNQIPQSAISKLFVGLFGNPNIPDNQQIIAKAQKLQKTRAAMPYKRAFELDFFDVSTAQVWG